MNVIITGSNRGIGKAMVEAFATSGANIWACARKSTPEHEAWLKETAEKANVWIKPVYFELTDKDAINAGIQSIIDEGQSIDVLVNHLCLYRAWSYRIYTNSHWSKFLC